MDGIAKLLEAAGSDDGLGASEDMFEPDRATVVLPEDVSQSLSNIVRRAFQQARARGVTKVVFDMTSRGGEADHMDVVLSEFEAWKARKGHKVVVVVRGMCASAGILMLALASPGYRIAVPFTKFLIHAAYTGQAIGRVNAQAEREAKWHQFCTREAFARIERATGRPLGFFEKLLHKGAQGQDLNLDCKRAQQLGLVDVIGYPRFETRTITVVRCSVFVNEKQYEPSVGTGRIDDHKECRRAMVRFVSKDIDAEYKAKGAAKKTDEDESDEDNEDDDDEDDDEEVAASRKKDKKDTRKKAVKRSRKRARPMSQDAAAPSRKIARKEADGAAITESLEPSAPV